MKVPWGTKKSKIVVERGQIVKVSKDKDGIVRREVLTQNWTDRIDYWAVDFIFDLTFKETQIAT